MSVAAYCFLFWVGGILTAFFGVVIVIEYQEWRLMKQISEKEKQNELGV